MRNERPEKTLFCLIPGIYGGRVPFGDRVKSGREHSMLTRLVPRLRSYGAIILIAVDIVCVVMSSIALAFPSATTHSHCLTNDHHEVSEVRLRGGLHIPTLGDSSIDKHVDNSMKGGDSKLKCHAGGCCGLSCFAALTSDSAATIVRPVHASSLFQRLDESLDGCRPERISRPPKPFLSL